MMGGVGVQSNAFMLKWKMIRKRRRWECEGNKMGE